MWNILKYLINLFGVCMRPDDEPRKEPEPVDSKSPTDQLAEPASKPEPDKATLKKAYNKAYYEKTKEERVKCVACGKTYIETLKERHDRKCNLKMI
jgi:hypothetical protein